MCNTLCTPAFRAKGRNPTPMATLGVGFASVCCSGFVSHREEFPQKIDIL